MKIQSKPHQDPEALVKKWLENIVIGLNLCPFAKKEFIEDNIRYKVYEGRSDETLLSALEAELSLLDSNHVIETSILIIKYHTANFPDYCDILNLAEKMLIQSGLDRTYQLASFHPDYQFAGTTIESVENFTNRSPYPLIHILRECSVSRAVQSHPDSTTIPTRNIDLMNSFDVEALDKLFSEFMYPRPE